MLSNAVTVLRLIFAVFLGKNRIFLNADAHNRAATINVAESSGRTHTAIAHDHPAHRDDTEGIILIRVRSKYLFSRF